jgi:GrpB-like predicted nucleotidyltransferase (UPF0157 family)
MARKVEVVPYDPIWPDVYRVEMAQISVIVGANLVSVHHIGSTAVPGLAAKPTIDMLLVVRDVKRLDTCNNKMSGLGYHPKGENGIPGRRYFQKLDGEVHLVHIHAFETGHPEITRYINFRDYLFEHPETAQAYQDLKQQLAESYKFAPAQYTSGKDAFIRAVDQRAAAWRAETIKEHSATE